MDVFFANAWFLVKNFLIGMGLGLLLKILLAVVFKMESTFGGLVRTMLVCGIIYEAMVLWILFLV